MTLYTQLVRYLQHAPDILDSRLVGSFVLETLDVPLDKAIAVKVDQPCSQSNPEGFNIAASKLAVDRALDVIRRLDGSQDQDADQRLCAHMLRLLCAYEREPDAEWVLSLAKNMHGKHIGDNIAAMMAMYYRRGNAARAESLFEEFKETCEHGFRRIRNVTVMPDGVSVQVEKWQLEHEDGIEKPNVISTRELWRFRSRHSAPFFRKALEHVYRKEVDKAVACLQESRYKGWAALNPSQLDAIILSMIGHGYLADAFGVFASFRSSMNAAGGTGIATHQVISSDLPSHLGLAVLLKEFGRTSDWNRVWQIIIGVKDVPGKLVRVETVQALLLQALASKDWPQAIKFANSIATLVFRDGSELQGFSDDCMRSLFGCLVEHGAMLSCGERHLLTEVIESLLHKNALAMGSVYEEWNSCILQCAFDSIDADTLTESLRLWNEISDVISKYDLSKQQLVCLTITNAAISLLDSVPEKYRSVPTTIAQIADSGWNGFVLSSNSSTYEAERQEAVWVAGLHSKGSDRLWECMLDVFTKSAHRQYPKSLFKYILLVFKFAFLGKVSLNRQVANSANEALLAANQPTVDPRTGDLLSYGKLTNIREHSRELKLSGGDTPSSMSNAPRTAFARDKALAGASAGQASMRIKYDTPIREKLKWYKNCRKNVEIPHYSTLKLVLKDAIKNGMRDHWEPIVRDHMPKYLESLSSCYSGDVTELRRKYADAIWSQAINQYAALGEIEEAADFFRRIVWLGGYPVSHATAGLLTSLVASSLPLPVLPKDWHGEARKVFKMEPAYPPQGDSSADLFILPSNLGDRNKIVAEIGLSMLYSMLRREIWPTTYFYCVLFSVLGQARMDAPLKHIFSN
ncbi:hypothetical protein GGI22_004578, partial [Coemansia erecta]